MNNPNRDITPLRWHAERSRLVTVESLIEFYEENAAHWPQTTAPDTLHRLVVKGLVGKKGKITDKGNNLMCPKARYGSLQDAEQVLAKLVLRKSLRRNERRAYQCPVCKGWHLTSQEHRAPR